MSSPISDIKKNKEGLDPEVESATAYEADAKNIEAGRAGIIEHDAVFGDITEDGPNYRNVRHHLGSYSSAYG
jgi:hypothetical protein